MAKEQSVQRNRPPARTVEGRENQLIALAIDVAEQQLRTGKASSQVITHYLKLGSTREKIEKDVLEKKLVLMEAQTKALDSAETIKELYTNAMNSMRSYRGDSHNDEK